MVQNTLENHQKSHPKSMQTPSKNHEKLMRKKDRFWGFPPGDPGIPLVPVRVPKINKTHTDILQKDNKRQTT